MSSSDWEDTREWKAVNVLAKDSGKGRRKQHPPRKRGCGCGCAVVLLIFLFAVGAAAWYLGLLRHDLVPGVKSEKTVPILLLGVDRETGKDVGRSDTIILCFMNPKDKSVRLLSIPRDTYTDVPVRGKKDKINAAYAQGGSDGALEAVSLLLGREIKYYLATDFQGFEKIVDTLGGVTVQVDEKISKAIDLPPGTHRLKGEQALVFVRFRGYPMADLERIKHQQVFLKALADEALQPSNIWKAPQLAGDMRSAVETNLSTAQMIDLGKAMKSLDSSQMECYTLPGRPQYMNGISYYLPDTGKIEPLLNALFEGTAVPAE